MSHDSAFFRRRAAEARADAARKEDSETVEIAGHLALAFSALERRRRLDPAASARQLEPDID